MKSFFRTKFSYCLLVILFSSIVMLSGGCNSGVYTVSGTVLFEDATPLDTGTVTFQSSSYVATGTLDQSGKYSLQVPPGDYTVFIPFSSKLDPDFVAPANEPDAVHYIEMIDGKFVSAANSPLKCTVEKGMKYDITVTPPGK